MLRFVSSLPPRIALNLATALIFVLSPFVVTAKSSDADQPNFVVIFCDDLGYGDLRSFGNPTIKTPHLDRMAQEGQKWTQFYSADPVCTPSRAGLLTGRYPHPQWHDVGQTGRVFPRLIPGPPRR